jgi:hypothetical protein
MYFQLVSKTRPTNSSPEQFYNTQIVCSIISLGFIVVLTRRQDEMLVNAAELI